GCVPVRCQTKRIHERGVEDVGITKSERLNHVAVAGCSRIEDVFIERIRKGLAEKAIHVTAEYGVVIVALVIDLSHDLAFIADRLSTISDQPAGVGGLGQVPGDPYS